MCPIERKLVPSILRKRSARERSATQCYLRPLSRIDYTIDELAARTVPVSMTGLVAIGLIILA
jgi:hypothetical protein